MESFYFQPFNNAARFSFMIRKLKRKPNRYNVVLIFSFLIGILFGFGAWTILNIHFFPVCRSCFQKEVSQIENKSEIQNSLLNLPSKKPRILCWVLTSPKTHRTRAIHVRDTWGKHCDILLFLSNQADPELPTVGLPVADETRKGLWSKVKEGFKYAYNNYHGQYDWLYKTDDNAFSIVDNMRHMVEDMDPSKPLYMGERGKIKFRNVSGEFLLGGPGILLSQAAVKKFVDGLTEQECADPKNFTRKEDIRFSYCMQYLGMELVDSRDPQGRLKFVTVNLLSRTFPWGWFKSHNVFFIGKGYNCCSPTLVATHPVTPLLMYLLDFMLYEVDICEISWNSDSDKEIMTKVK